MNNIIDNHSLTDGGYFLVREHWPDQTYDSVTHYDYIFVTPLKMFKKNTWRESKKEAELYYARRIKDIRVRKLMFPELDKKHFTLTLSYAELEVDIGHKESKIEETNERNMPYNEDLKDGLFRKKE